MGGDGPRVKGGAEKGRDEESGGQNEKSFMIRSDRRVGAHPAHGCKIRGIQLSQLSKPVHTLGRKQ